MLCFPVFIAYRPCICPAPRPLAVWRLRRLPRLDRGHVRASPDFPTSLPLRVIPLTHRLFLFMRLRTLSFSISLNPFVCHSYENNRGVAQLFPFWIKTLATHLSPMYLSSFFSNYSALFCTFLHLPKTQPFYFQAIPNSLRKTPGGGVSLRLLRPASLLPSESHILPILSLAGACEPAWASLPALPFQPSTVDRRSRPCRDYQPPLRRSSPVTEHTSHPAIPEVASAIIKSERGIFRYD